MTLAPVREEAAMVSRELEAQNPVMEFVEQNHNNYEISNFKNFARTCGVSEQTITKINKGLYNQLPPSVAKTLAHYSGRTVNEWGMAYKAWRDECIAMLKKDIEEGRIPAESLYLSAEEITQQFESFVDWRRSLHPSLMGFCSEFYLHQGTMYRYESGEGFDIPVVLKDRLLFLGCDEDYINALKRLPRRTLEL